MNKNIPKLLQMKLNSDATKLIQNFCKCNLTALQQNDSSMDIDGSTLVLETVSFYIRKLVAEICRILGKNSPRL